MGKTGRYGWNDRGGVRIIVELIFPVKETPPGAGMKDLTSHILSNLNLTSECANLVHHLFNCVTLRLFTGIPLYYNKPEEQSFGF